MTAIYGQLKDIVGEAFVSDQSEELYLYARDPGASLPGRADFVVMPENTGDVRKIVMLAAKNSLPLVPISAGLTLSGLALPLEGGIVMDMRRMDRIIAVNQHAMYALIEPGVSQGQLISYLDKHHPRLRHSVPDAPPAASVAGNALIYGSGHHSRHGAHSEMIEGLEVVLASGEVVRLGASSLSDYWFSRGPLPDLATLFINAFGTTGIVTKLSLKLYPRHKYRDMAVFVLQNPETIPDAIGRITATDMMEDVLIVATKMPSSPALVSLLIVYYTADSEDELSFKEDLFKGLFTDLYAEEDRIVYTPQEMLPQKLIRGFMEEPQYAAAAADLKKGGGFEYVGVTMPLSRVPAAWKMGAEIANDNGFSPMYTLRNIGYGHSIIFAFGYPFNRADEKSLEAARKAMEQTNASVLNIGGVPWKPEVNGQRMILDRMDPGAVNLLSGIRRLLDPEGIMNPGNWDNRPGGAPRPGNCD